MFLVVAMILKNYFLQKCCFLSQNLILCERLVFTLDLRRNWSEEENSEAGNMFRICLFLKHLNLSMLTSLILIDNERDARYIESSLNKRWKITWMWYWDLPTTLNFVMETLHFNCWRPTGDPPQTSKKNWNLFNFFPIAVPATSRHLYGNMIAVGHRWVAGSFRSSIDVNTIKNDFHYSFVLKFPAEESLSPVGRRWVKSIWKYASVAMSLVGRRWVAGNRKLYGIEA